MDNKLPELYGLTEGQWWLVMHQMIAFWHGFGISNGLDVPAEMVEPSRFKDFKGYHIKAEYMREQLAGYIKWLKSYREKWNDPNYEGVDGARNEQEILENHGSNGFDVILDMIKLLQDRPIQFS